MSKDKRERDMERERKKSGLKLHHYRFVKFMEYLKEHDAIISVLPEGASEGSTRRLEYGFKGGDHLKMNQLLIQALNIKPDRAEDYMTNKGSLKAAHAIGERFRGLGDFITSIEYYFESDTPIDEASELPDDISPFSLAYTVFLPANSDKSNVKDLWDRSRSSFITRQLPELFKSRFDHEKRLDDNRTKRFSKLAFNCFPFKAQLQELEYALNSILFNRDKFSGYAHFELRRDSMLQTYYEMQSELREPLFLPGYVDYFIPGGNYDRTKYLYRYKYEAFLDELLETPALSSEYDLILYRYELIWYLIDQNVSVSDWQLEIQILLLIIYYEHYAMMNALADLAGRLVSQTRFVVYGSEDGQTHKAQQHGLDTDALAILLQNFQFRKGLDQAFSIYDNQILEEALLRYPESGAVKNLRSREKIQTFIEDMLFEFFEKKLWEGYNVL